MIVALLAGCGQSSLLCVESRELADEVGRVEGVFIEHDHPLLPTFQIQFEQVQQASVQSCPAGEPVSMAAEVDVRLLPDDGEALPAILSYARTLRTVHRDQFGENSLDVRTDDWEPGLLQAALIEDELRANGAEGPLVYLSLRLDLRALELSTIGFFPSQTDDGIDPTLGPSTSVAAYAVAPPE